MVFFLLDFEFALEILIGVDARCDLLGRKMENARGARIKQMALESRERERAMHLSLGSCEGRADRFCVSLSLYLVMALKPGGARLKLFKH